MGRNTQLEESGAIDQGWGSALLPEGLEIQAVCTQIETVTYRQWNQRKKVLLFQVVEPTEFSYFQGEKDKEKPRPVALEFFVREELHWKKPPMRSKLRRVLYVAQYGRPTPGVKQITPELFKGKLFLCRVKTAGKDCPYSEVDTILEKLTG